MAASAFDTIPLYHLLVMTKVPFNLRSRLLAPVYTLNLSSGILHCWAGLRHPRSSRLVALKQRWLSFSLLAAVAPSRIRAAGALGYYLPGCRGTAVRPAPQRLHPNSGRVYCLPNLRVPALDDADAGVGETGGYLAEGVQAKVGVLEGGVGWLDFVAVEGAIIDE